MRGASIGCWIRQCRKSFHLPCAIENNCAYEFTDETRSYCDVHFASNTLNTAESHSDDESCAICMMQMGNFCPYKSMQLVCCHDEKWYHRECLRQMAFRQNDDFECPSCEDKIEFRYNMLANGIYIPSAEYIQTDSLSSEENIAPITKRRRIHKDYIYERTFDTKQQAEDHLVSNGFSYYYQNSSSAGLRITYRCNQMKFRGAQCTAGKYLLFDSTNKSIHLYRADAEHTHNDAGFKENAVNKISGVLESEIRTMFGFNMKPKLILYNLVIKGLQPPTKSQLSTFLTKLRKEKFGACKLDYGSLEEWLVKNETVPLEDDHPFIVGHEMIINDDNYDASMFRFLVSTKRLLNNAINMKKIHADATYKLIWQGFPVLIAGATDSNRKFHPIGVCVSTNEQTSAFKFLFGAIKNKTKELFGVEIEPSVLISDAAPAIRNGFKAIFTEVDDIGMCAAHVRRNLDNNLPQYLSDSAKRDEFIGNLFDLSKKTRN